MLLSRSLAATAGVRPMLLGLLVNRAPARGAPESGAFWTVVPIVGGVGIFLASWNDL